MPHGIEKNSFLFQNIEPTGYDYEMPCRMRQVQSCTLIKVTQAHPHSLCRPLYFNKRPDTYCKHRRNTAFQEKIRR